MDLRLKVSSRHILVNGTDKISYNKHLNPKQLAEKVRSKSVKDFSNNVWLPEKPEILYMIEDKEEELKEKSESRSSLKTLNNEIYIKEKTKFENDMFGGNSN